jgi:hypothetical protein
MLWRWNYFRENSARKQMRYDQTVPVFLREHGEDMRLLVVT